jgi:hypothetical protein
MASAAVFPSPPPETNSPGSDLFFPHLRVMLVSPSLFLANSKEAFVA